MPRYAYQLRIREGCEDEYDRRHVAVWPVLLNDLADAGVREYSIFRRGQQLFLYLHVWTTSTTSSAAWLPAKPTLAGRP